MEIILALLCLSLGLNIFGYFKFKQKQSEPIKEPIKDYDCHQLLHDLTQGHGFVKITRVAPDDFFLRSPRGRNP